MQQTAIIFMGRSGSGKGTQGALMTEYFKKHAPATPIIYLQGGNELREFIVRDDFTGRAARAIYDRGDLEPEFLMIYLWAKRFVDSYKGGENVIVDGTPRKLHEAGVLHSLFTFYQYPKPFVVYLNVPKPITVDRLLARGRKDDHKDEIEERLAWFDTHVIPTIAYYEHNPHYNFIEVDGDRPIDVVHADIIERMQKITTGTR